MSNGTCPPSTAHIQGITITCTKGWRSTVKSDCGIISSAGIAISIRYIEPHSQ